MLSEGMQRRKGNMKVLTIRIPDDLHAAVAVVSRVEGNSVNKMVEGLIREHVEKRGKDPAFRRRATTLVAEDRRALNALTKG